MSAEVQHLLDRLADDIGRSVVINDPAVVMLYSSRHFGDEDPVRVEAMLNRVAGSAAIAHVLAQDVGRWTRPGRIPAKPAIGMRARLCVPLRWRGDLLGLLMVIDADDDLPAADRARIDAAAREVAALLVGERAAADAAVAADDALVAELLSLDPAARERAVAALATRSPDRAGWQASEPAGRQAGGQAAEPAGRSAPERLRGPSRSLQVVALRGVTADRAQAEVALRHAVLDARRTGLATVAGPTAAAVRFSGDTMALAERMIAAANEVAGGRFTCVAGVGPRVATLEEAWTSHRHAELATRADPAPGAGPGGGRGHARRVRPAATDPGARPHRAARAGRDAAGRRPPWRARAHPGGLPATRGLRARRRGRAAHPPHHAALPPRPRYGRSPAATRTTARPASSCTWVWGWRACWVCSPASKLGPVLPRSGP